jgi:hypothetical protein
VRNARAESRARGRGQGVPEVRAEEEDEEVPELQDVGREIRRLQRDALQVPLKNAGAPYLHVGLSTFVPG